MEICVITGGGSGMGLAAARYMDKEKALLLAGRTPAKLEQAAQELQELGFTVFVKPCDVQDRESVKEMASFAARLGTVKTVIHAAGISPAMGTPEQIVRVNALGTIYVNRELSPLMPRGGVIVDMASNSGYALPSVLVPYRLFARAELDTEWFVRKLVARSRLISGAYYKAGIAYALSKAFVIWYAAKCAFELGKKGIRVCSVSPGLVDTEMGAMEKEKGDMMLRATAEGRMGTPDELGFAIAAAADERNGFLAGTDLLCDGGATMRRRRFRYLLLQSDNFITARDRVHKSRIQ